MRTKITTSALSLLLLASASAASTPDPELFDALRWRLVGPYRGGRVTTVAGVPGQPLVYYQGATGGGVWKTENAGLTWENVSDGYFRTGSVGAIAVAPSNPDVVYVGMGEACIRNNLSHGDGIYKSQDAGKTWKHLGLADTRQIGQIRIHPHDPDLVYVAAIGHPFGPNEERGVFRSRDGGASWEKVLYVDENTGAVDLALDVTDPRVLYAATWQVRRRPWGIYSFGAGSGIYKTTDGGDTWRELTEGLPAGDKGRIGVAVSPVEPKRVWAVVPAEEDYGLYRSDDAGESWSLVNGDFHMVRREYYYSHVYADTQDVDTVYVLTAPFMKSTDGGKTFTFIRVPHGDNHALWIAPEDNRRMINANDGGANVSLDGGASWSSIENQPTGQFYWVITDDQFPYRIYGAQQDNTTLSLPSRTNGPGILLSDAYPVGGGESGDIAPDPEDPNIVYAGSYWGLLTRYDHRTGESRNIAVWPEMPLGKVGAELKYRFNWSFPIIVSRHDPRNVYAAANVVFRTTNEGQSWEVVSPDLTRNDPDKQQHARLSDFFCTIIALAESPVEEDLIWAGSDDGLVHVTRDGGKTWTNVTPEGMETWSRVNLIEPSPHDPAAAYLAVNRYQWDDFRPYIYKTKDYGQSWELVTEGIREDVFVRTVREDPERRGLLYAGTETGVYVSFDDGASWQSLQTNLPVVPITDLAVAHGDLVAATQGRAFWVLDDLSPIRQLTPEVLSSDAYLFAPREAYRFRSARGFRRGPEAGENPPAGLLVHYYVGEAPQGEAVLEFLDGEGSLIESFTAEELPFEPGLHRFEWDMRYPDARGLSGRETHLFGGGLQGPLAVPGTYTVRLRVGDESLTQTFDIRKDPRLTETTEEGLQEQFDLLIRIRDRVTETHEAASRILDLQEELDRAVENAPGQEIRDRAEELRSALASVLEQLVELRFRGIDDQMLVFPLKLNARIASLQRVVASADRNPTDAAYQVFDELSAALDRQLGRLRVLLEEDLGGLNELLRREGLEEIRPEPQ